MMICMVGEADFQKNNSCYQVRKMQKELQSVYNHLLSSTLVCDGSDDQHVYQNACLSSEEHEQFEW